MHPPADDRRLWCMPAAGEHHPAFEEYCECIFELAEDDVDIIQARIADRLQVSRPAVSEMIRKLEAEGLITNDGAIVLTETGSALAQQIVRRHRLAERLIPDRREVAELIDSLQQRMRIALLTQYRIAHQQLESLSSKSVLTRPVTQIRQLKQELDRCDLRMTRAIQQKILNGDHQLREMAARLESLNPVSVLARGYSITTDQSGVPLTDCDSLAVGDTIATRLRNGTVISLVKSTS